MKLGMGVFGCLAENIEHYLDLAAETGFESVFADSCSACDGARMARWRRGCDDRGIELETAHCSLSESGVWNYRLWLEGGAGDEVLDTLKLNADVASEYGVPILVCHVDVRSSERNSFDLGIRRLEDLVEYAGRKHVRIAFENINCSEYLFKIMELFPKDRAGFCYDSGHHLCATPEADYSPLYPRLLCCHLHDNHGGVDERMQSDEHLLPFEGKVDFPLRMRQFREAGYTGNLTIESGYENRRDRSISEGEFMLRAYRSAARLRKLCADG